MEGYKNFSEKGRRKVILDGVERMFAVAGSSRQFVVQEEKYITSFASYLDAHECLGHPGETVMFKLKSQYPDLIPNKPKEFYCPACVLSKSTHKSQCRNKKRLQDPSK